MTTDEHAELLRQALKSLGKYTIGLEPLLESYALSKRILEAAKDEIDRDMFTPTIQGYNGTMVENPVCKVIRDAQMSVTRHLKLMGLSQADLGTVDDTADRLADLTQQLIDVK